MVAGNWDAACGAEEEAEDPDLLIQSTLERTLSAAASAKAPRRLASAMRHAVFAGGSRVRPKLCLAVARAAGADGAGCKAALEAGAGIEFLHCASLVHDDLPCFDDADSRRGAPSVHSAFGEALAVLTGDALIVLGFQSVLGAAAASPSLAVELSRILGAAAGAPHGIVAGQAWESEIEIDLRAYHRSKTGALFVAACEAGAVCGGADPAAWRDVGVRLGEAYQIADDIRDVVCRPEDIGKPSGVDTQLGRPNSVHILGLEGAAEQLHELMRDAADAVPESPGANTLRLLVLAQATRLLGATELATPDDRRA